MSDVITELPDLVADWQGGVGTFTDEAGTTPATVEGANVRRWEDQHGGFHLTTTDTPPTVTAESPYKEQPGVTFDRDLGHYLHNAAWTATSGVTEGTWISAYERDHNGQSQYIVDSQDSQCLAMWDNGGSPTLAWATGNLTRWPDNAYHGKLGIFRYDGSLSAPTRTRLRLNRSDRAVSQLAGTIGATTLVSAPGLWVGSQSGGTAGLTGTILRLAYVDRAITDEECDEIVDLYASTHFEQGHRKFFVLGDSIPYGYPLHTSDGEAWPDLLVDLLGAPWEHQVNAIVAMRTAQMESSGLAAIDPDHDDWRDREVVMLECGTNDLVQGHTTEQALVDMTASVAARHTQGFTEVYVQTLPFADPRLVGVSMTPAEYDLERLPYNAALLAGDTGADGVLDLAVVPGFFDPINASYYTGDLVHFDTPGAAATAAAALAFLDGPPPDPPPPSGGTGAALLLVA